jgi:hypothetical protein
MRQRVLGDEAFAFVILNFNKEPLWDDAIDDAVKRLANTGHEELDLLVFDGGAFGLSRAFFHVGTKQKKPAEAGFFKVISAQ